MINNDDHKYVKTPFSFFLLPPLGWGYDLPDAVLVAGVNVREGGAGDGAIVGVDDSSTGVLTASLIRMELVPDTTGAGVSYTDKQ